MKRNTLYLSSNKASLNAFVTIISLLIPTPSVAHTLSLPPIHQILTPLPPISSLLLQNTFTTQCLQHQSDKMVATPPLSDQSQFNTLSSPRQLARRSTPSTLPPTSRPLRCPPPCLHHHPLLIRRLFYARYSVQLLAELTQLSITQGRPAYVACMVGI
jgi:hypothetical protein